jgi:hypothetical protein
VAVYSQGASVSFSGVAATQVVSVSVDVGGSLPKGRGVSWTDELGTVTVEMLGSQPYGYGSYGTLTVSGGGLSLTGNAVCVSNSQSAQVNDVTKYSATFQLIG